MASNISEELARLAQLRDQGVLTEDEFQIQKATLLRGEQAPQTSNPPKKSIGAGKGCLIVLAVLIGLIVLASIVGSSKKTTPSPGAVASGAPSTPPLAVTATELFNAYQSNEAAAQKQYGDQPLLVSGTVDGVDLDFGDKPKVRLRTPNEFMSAQASLTEASEPKASSLSKGEKVKLMCGGVSEIIGTPMLKDCEIQ